MSILDSGANLMCGPDGSPILEIDDWVPASTHFIKKLCVNVKGASSVMFSFYGFGRFGDRRNSHEEVT